ncbi:protein KTI12 [Marchantia polymorpha subsp. ruderalis]|uniref:Protein KTI12 homolog n=1 Tax=Marchantia polymorpha TaxID=3197 RepID=A0A2R6XMF7_MARPO|nr:hypothetical protein MARPO_0008s0061 [Marchantia polymorpha]BBN19541.1 hypothetical protein Mp_8g11550 [Marchantia polymorpha subsp. ruderalis]|eukprot:PTQ47282.1 hypothetical protein MARPO_0008s0061 [Marchantia polymorpha]
MALVVMCGQPCSGKSSAAAALIKALEKAKSKPVSLINEPSLNLDRNESFKDMPSEKNLRGVLRSAVDRKSSKDAIVIIDSLNNIKGYRYELWCLARAAGILYCVLHCDAGEEDCRAWNQLRQKEGAASYEDRIFDDLVRRFERPDGKNRWDSPLFEHKSALEKIDETSEAIVKATAFLTGSGVPGSRNSGVLQPTVATQTTRHADTNSLYELDRATQEVMKILVEAQTQGSGAVVRKVPIGDGIPEISLQRSVGLPELRRLKRTFVKLASQTSLSGTD